MEKKKEKTYKTYKNRFLLQGIMASALEILNSSTSIQASSFGVRFFPFVSPFPPSIFIVKLCRVNS